MLIYYVQYQIWYWDNGNFGVHVPNHVVVGHDTDVDNAIVAFVIMISNTNMKTATRFLVVSRPGGRLLKYDLGRGMTLRLEK